MPWKNQSRSIASFSCDESWTTWHWQEKYCFRFLSDAPKQLTGLSKALDDKQIETIKAFSHKIKGVTSIIGATTMNQIAVNLETQARLFSPEQSSDFSPLENIYSELKNHFIELKAEIEKFPL